MRTATVTARCRHEVTAADNTTSTTTGYSVATSVHDNDNAIVDFRRKFSLAGVVSLCLISWKSVIPLQRYRYLSRRLFLVKRMGWSRLIGRNFLSLRDN